MKNLFFSALMTCCALMLVRFPAIAQDPVPAPHTPQNADPKRSCSPYAARNSPTRPLWGDMHLHTEMSMDAGALGARLGPDDAYRFAKGEELVSSNGMRVQLSRPLDFLVVADLVHAVKENGV